MLIPIFIGEGPPVLLGLDNKTVYFKSLADLFLLFGPGFFPLDSLNHAPSKVRGSLLELSLFIRVLKLHHHTAYAINQPQAELGQDFM